MASVAHRLRVALLLALAGAFLPSASNADVMLDQAGDIWLWPHFEIYLDAEGQLSAAQVAAVPEARWSRLERRHQHLGNRPEAVLWARFTLVADLPGQRRWMLVHQQSFVDEVALYGRAADGGWRLVTGLREATTGWFGGVRNPSFALDISAGESRDFLLRASTQSLLRLPLLVRPEAVYFQAERASYMASGALIAIPLAASLFIFLLWRIQRRQGLLTVIGLILSEVIGASWVGGVLHAVLPVADPRSLGLVGMLSWASTVALGYRHARLFLYLDRDAPRLARAYRIAPWFVLVALGLEFAGSPWGRNLLIYFAFFTLISFVATSLWQAWRGVPFAQVYAAAWGTYFASVSLIVINLLGAIPPNVSNLLMFAQGSIVSLLLAFAVAGQLRDRERQMLADLKDSKLRFALAAEGAAVGLFDWDLRRGQVDLSATTNRLLQLPQSVGLRRVRDLRRALPVAARRRLIGALAGARRAAKTRLLTELELAGRPLGVSGAMAYAGGELVRVTGSVADLTEMRALQESRDRNRLFAATNHDLRQPLQSLGLFIELISQRSSDEQISRWADQMREAHASVADTLDSVLALSRLESHSMEVIAEDFALDDLLQSLASEYAVVAAKRGLELRIRPTRHWVRTDRRLLERILRNLISNALNYTPQGRVLVGCRTGGGRVRIQVLDTGPGIVADQQAAIFDEFRQGQAGRQAGVGVGLGLAIVRGLAERLKAPLSLRSQVERGSCFEIAVPRVRPQPDSAPVKPAAPRSIPARLLVVDDQPAVREGLVAALAARGAAVRGASSPADALACLSAGFHPAAAVLDHRLGESATGLACLRALEARLGSPLPAVLISGEGAAVEQLRADGYAALRKPVALDVLIVTLLEQLQSVSRDATAGRG